MDILDELLPLLETLLLLFKGVLVPNLFGLESFGFPLCGRLEAAFLLETLSFGFDSIGNLALLIV